MNTKALFHIIGEISDDFIMEADSAAKKVRRMRLSRAVVLAAAITALLGLSVFASGTIVKNRNSTGSNIPYYHSVPSQRTLQKAIGIAPRMPKQFTNGYAFYTGNILKNEDCGENDQVLEKYQSLFCQYRRGGSQLSIHVDGAAAGLQMNGSETAAVYKKSEIKYAAYTNKIVPGNYQLTEQDLEDQTSGKYVFSFGGEGITVSEVQILGWEYDGLCYSICAIDNPIAQGELVQMAKELIDNQNEAKG